MRQHLTRRDALAFRERWRLVRERQWKEARSMSIQERFRRLALLMRARRCLPDTGRSEGEEEVRNRWNRLREVYLA